MQYGKKIKSVYMEYKDAYNAYKERLKQIREDEAAGKIGAALCLEQTAEANDNNNEARISAKATIQDIVNKHAEAVEAWNDYKPEQITPDVDILKLGIKLGADRLERMAEKHKGNSLMQNLIMQQAQLEDVKINVPGFYSKDDRLREFELYAERANLSIDEPEGMRAGLFEADYAVPDVVNVDY